MSSLFPHYRAVLLLEGIGFVIPPGASLPSRLFMFTGADQQVRYNEYLKHLVNTHVLWAVVPCLPSNPNARDRRRYANDLRITLGYLREALRLRSLKQPVAVALVLSKIGTLFQDPEEARDGRTIGKDRCVAAIRGPK